jgi:hypothetical protein
VIGDRLQMKLDVNRQASNQPPQKRPFLQQPSGIRREVICETAGTRETPPPWAPAKYFYGVYIQSKQTTIHSNPGKQG